MIEDHVPTLEICERLKAAGFPQETIFQWAIVMTDELQPTRVVNTDWDDEAYDCACAAPVLTEILEQLPLSDEHDYMYSVILDDSIFTVGQAEWWSDRDIGVGNPLTHHMVKRDKSAVEGAALLYLSLKEADGSH